MTTQYDQTKTNELATEIQDDFETSALNNSHESNNGNHNPLNQDKKKNVETQSSLLQKFYDLPIQKKELVIAGTSFASMLALVGAGGLVLFNSLESQLLRQAEAETTVTEIQYNIKIDQMGFGFRGQADNLAIIAAAKQNPITPDVAINATRILKNEIKARNIEYATLVGVDLKIIVSANANRQGQIFNPDGLVQKVINDPKQIKATSVVKWSELEVEKPPLPEGFNNQDALIRYTVTPVKDPANQKLLGVLVSGDIVNNKLAIVQNTVDALDGGYSSVYAQDSNGEFALATSLAEANINILLQDESILKEAVEANGEAISKIIKLDGIRYAIAAKTLPNVMMNEGSGVFVPQETENLATAIMVRGIPESDINNLLGNNLTLQILISILILGLNTMVILLISKAITKPIKNLQKSTKAFSQGDQNARAKVFYQDELGELATSFNILADKTLSSITEIEEAKEIAENLANQQKRETENLQTELFQLLNSVEGASEGDLTVRAEISAGQIGIVGDFFNAIIENLRDIVIQVQDSTTQVNNSLEKDEKSIANLAKDSSKQAKKIERMLGFVEQMEESIQDVAQNAQTAAEVAKTASNNAQDGGEAMDRTVDNIVQLRETVAQTAKKVKRLGESSQQISKVISLINQIALQTNLLAINASIEAARAGEEGRGFAVVAEEVGQLAAQSAMATKEIEQIVETIQLETSEVVEAMEIGTTQVVEGTQLVETTKESLSKIVSVSRQIDDLVASISEATVSQTKTSELVTNLMKDIVKVSQSQSDSSVEVSDSLQETFNLAKNLQQSVENFKVEADS